MIQKTLIKRHQLENIVPLAFTLSSVLIIYSYYYDQYYNYVGILFMAVGLLLWWWGKLTLGDAFTMLPKAKMLVIKGIYSKVKHPIYIGLSLVLMGWSVFLWSGFLTIFTLVTIIILFTRAYFEEKALLKKYGKKYQKYKDDTWF